MYKKLLALLLLVIGAIGVLPYMPQATALLKGWVDTPGTDQARFRLLSPTDLTQLVACSANPITIRQGVTRNEANWTPIRCWTNYPQPLNVTFSLVDGGGVLTNVQNAAAVTLQTSDSLNSQCRRVSMTAADPSGNSDVSGTAYMKAAFATTDQKFSGEINFPVSFTAGKTSGKSGGSTKDDSFSCP